MLFKYLLVVVIFYFIVKTSGNLMRAMRGEVEAGYRDARFQDHGVRGRTRSSSEWSTRRTNEASSSRRAYDEDIEDAEWEDLD